MSAILSINEPLSHRSRFAWSRLSRTEVSLSEVLILVGCGLTAAGLSALVDFSLRIPGHAILRAVFPISLGMALVPRRGAGLTMGTAALTGILGLSVAGAAGIGLGATTSLVLLGPILDLVVRRVRPGWRLYGGFALAGLGANLAAFAIRGGAKMTGGIGAGIRPFTDWLGVAPISYAACGLIAGVLSAVVWFRLRDRPEGRD